MEALPQLMAANLYQLEEVTAIYTDAATPAAKTAFLLGLFAGRFDWECSLDNRLTPGMTMKTITAAVVEHVATVPREIIKLRASGAKLGRMAEWAHEYLAPLRGMNRTIGLGMLIMFLGNYQPIGDRHIPAETVETAFRNHPRELSRFKGIMKRVLHNPFTNGIDCHNLLFHVLKDHADKPGLQLAFIQIYSELFQLELEGMAIPNHARAIVLSLSDEEDIADRDSSVDDRPDFLGKAEPQQPEDPPAASP